MRRILGANLKQSDVFLESEGDAWFRRNVAGQDARKLPDGDPLLRELLALPSDELAAGQRVLEIGCSDGRRLAWLREHARLECHGVDPSALAVASARARGVDAQRGTADSLPFEDATFDVVMFGFCLYLCDRSDLFRIASEADRVLKSPGWLLILDFYSPAPFRRAYSHHPGLFSHKMDYRTLFTWHPAYTCYSHHVGRHHDGAVTDDSDEWTSTSVLRKRLPAESNP
jgi:ubiquinone/menaquinone biosynthesis C-methylase UbiE